MNRSSPAAAIGADWARKAPRGGHEAHPTRLLRLRSNDPLEGAAPPRAPRPPRGTPRFLGQVVAGAKMPSGTDQVYLMSPVRLDGADAEGATATHSTDGTRIIPVVVIGDTPPQAGDLLVALAVGGRWVAESRSGSSPELSCSPCGIPKKNLTLSWTNVLFGPGSTPLVYTPPGQWISACTNQLLFALACPGSSITLTATYFLSGFCPTGQGQSCVSPGVDPFSLSLAGSSCSPFFLHYTVTGPGCPVLWSSGYTSLAISE